MKLAGEMLFNLELNASASFWLGLAAALLLVRVARLREREGALLLLALPLAKVVFDGKYWRLFPLVGRRLGPFLVAGAVGCAHTASGPYIDPVPIRLNELDATTWRAVGEGRPVVLELQPGDRIPVELVVDGEVIATDPGTATFMLKAKRAFFLRIAGTELKTSLDGKSFDAKPAAPGAFRIGLVKTTEKGPLVSVHITTPVHAQR